jgi:hypothetical protein
MRSAATILLLFISFGLFAQRQDIKGIETVVAAFDKALLSKDSAALNHLMNGRLSYGHSNGWVQTKRNVIDDLYSGKLVYQKINARAPEIEMEGNTAAARLQADVDVLLDGKPLQFKLKILQVWVWKNKHWELFARQSVKV